MKTELWREVLCWGTVITFLSAPLLVFTLHIISDQMPSFVFSAHLQEYKFLGGFYQMIAGLVFGLAGLNSFDRHSERRNGGRTKNESH